MWLALFCLLTALSAFLYATLRLDAAAAEGRAHHRLLRADSPSEQLPVAPLICYRLPSSINAAWLSVATCLGLLIVLVAHGAKQESLVAPAAVVTAMVTAGEQPRLRCAAVAAACHGMTRGPARACQAWMFAVDGGLRLRRRPVAAAVATGPGVRPHAHLGALRCGRQRQRPRAAGSQGDSPTAWSRVRLAFPAP
jgi:hypothetical protein